MGNQETNFKRIAREKGEHSPEADKAYAEYCRSMDAANSGRKKTRSELLGK